MIPALLSPGAKSEFRRHTAVVYCNSASRQVCDMGSHAFLPASACSACEAQSLIGSLHSCLPGHQVCRASGRGRALHTAQASTSGQAVSAADTSRRRGLLAASSALLLAAAVDLQPSAAWAVQGSTAGRLPGLKGPDGEGMFRYTRPEGKSGGHGVGWQEIPRYSFKVPAGWKESPVSIADLGGTEIDLRFSSADQGSLEIVVAPIARFMDVPEGAKYTIEQVGSPNKIISGFHPEIYGQPLQDEDLVNSGTHQGPDGLTYYNWELKHNHLVAATAYGNRMFLMALSANGRQWRRSADVLRQIQTSFQVVDRV